MLFPVSADVLNKLSDLVTKWGSAKIPGTRDLLSLTVILIVQSGTGDLKFLAEVLDIASGESKFMQALLPTVRSGHQSGKSSPLTKYWDVTELKLSSAAGCCYSSKKALI